MVSFQKIPIDSKVPGAYAEVDPSGAKTGLAGEAKRVLIIGTKHASGATATALTPYLVSSAVQAAELFGQGSMLHHMVKAFKANNGITETWAIAMAEDGSGVASTRTLTWSGTATEDGVAYLMIGGRKIRVPIASGDAAADVAATAETYIDDDADGYVTCGTAAAVNTLTSKWKGATSLDIDVRINYYQGEKLPAGITLTIGAAGSGAVDPDVADVIAALGSDTQYTTIVMPYVDSANLTAMEDELVARWDPPRSIPGHLFVAETDSYANLVSFGTGRNSAFVTAMACPSMPTPRWEVAAAVAAGEALLSDPALPRHDIRLLGIIPPTDADAFIWSERNTLLGSGMSTMKIVAGAVYVERLMTMWQLNPQGFDDDTMSDIEVVRTLAAISYSLRYRFAVKYALAKLAADGTAFGAGQLVLTPGLARAECLSLFRAWELNGWVEDREQFADELVTEIDPDIAGRLNILLPPNLINQLRVTAARIAFKQ